MTEPRNGPPVSVDSPSIPESPSIPMRQVRRDDWQTIRECAEWIHKHAVSATYIRSDCFGLFCTFCGRSSVARKVDPWAAAHDLSCPVQLLCLAIAAVEMDRTPSRDREQQSGSIVAFPSQERRQAEFPPAAAEQPSPVQPAGDAGSYGEPWCTPLDALETVEDRAGRTIVDMLGSELPKQVEAAYARRIVACINFCNLLPTAALEASVGNRIDLVTVDPPAAIRTDAGAEIAHRCTGRQTGGAA